ncbi:penicillin-binding protein 1A [Paraburkholderia humisilvae]|uniref:Biosynthetic peptidoglycan transglycosylase n=1 Tax=Paraburkholderia humisilvae TaxID=627669 RepID=A0A6J5E6G7_9BURK|nr:transglycosylase domain-containing protein [Paraburkholderia humisilvae]CAB3761527.1 Biosynthetic peptidoglycan transglycosylase [Paraburkholderia humisilvae]
MHALDRVRHPTRRGIALTLAAVPALVLLYGLVLIPFTPGIGDIRKAKVEQPAQVMSADGKLLATFKPSNRDWVKLSDISPHVIDALISTEDHRFYEHHGIDWRRTASAALHTFSGDRQGGSTITQQLARNLYPDEIGRAPTLTRKVKEAITAFKIEAVYTKSEILETYLNTVPFLYNAYGIEMAARTYFDKSAHDLTVLESATLIGMLKGNSYYNPVINPDRALQRRNIVLAQMVKYQRLAPAAYQTLQRRPLGVDFERQSEPPGPAPHFAQQLRKWLIEWADAHDYNIYSDGLVVRTTIDSRLQTMATQALIWQGNQLQSIANAVWGTRNACAAHKDVFNAFVREMPEYRAAKQAGLADDAALKQVESDRHGMQTLCDDKTRVQAAFVAIDPRNGQIKAWVGSRDFGDDPYDHVSQARRQPGSTFKPFVYGAAFENGAKPDDTFIDQPVEITLAGGEIWKPTDDSPPSGRPVTLRDALAYSKNRITAQLMQEVGPSKVARLAYAMGVRDSRLEAVPSLALGTSPVTLKEMVSSYGTIADRGAYVAPMFVTRIEDRAGNVLAEFQPARAEQTLPPAAAQTLLDVMRDVIDKGTGSAIRTRFGIRADVAGKTGTTQDDADGWFILMHPQLVAGAWVGFNDSRVTLRSDYWGQGAHSALPIVGDFFQRALRARLVDPRAKFAEEQQTGVFDALRATLDTWWGHLFDEQKKPAPQKVKSAPLVQRRAPASASAPSQAASAAEPRDVEPPQIVAPGGASVPPLLSPPGAVGQQPASAPPLLSGPGATASAQTSLDQWINQRMNGAAAMPASGAVAPSGVSSGGSR